MQPPPRTERQPGALSCQDRQTDVSIRGRRQSCNQCTRSVIPWELAAGLANKGSPVRCDLSLSVTLLLIESKKETDRERGHLQCFQTAPTSLKLLSRAARKRKPQRLVRALFPVLWLFSRFSGVRLFVTPWTVAHQAPLPVGFSRQECCSGLPWPPPGDRVDSGIRTSVFRLLHWQAGWDLWKDYHQNHPSLPAPVENCAYPGILKVVRPIGCLTS